MVALFIPFILVKVPVGPEGWANKSHSLTEKDVS